jgi:GTP-binding protein Era
VFIARRRRTTPAAGSRGRKLLRPCHKGILIGAHGARIKALGARAREELASLLERKVHLFLNVKQRAGWDEERARLRAIGLEK